MRRFVSFITVTDGSQDLANIFATYDVDGNGTLDDNEAVLMICHMASVIHERSRNYARHKVRAKPLNPSCL